jgi:release factor glutamine methyltransferase
MGPVTTIESSSVGGKNKVSMSVSNQLPSVREAVQSTRLALSGISDSARLDAELLLATVLSKDRAWLYANPDTRLTDRQADIFRLLASQRAEGRPIAHLTGRREFWSLELFVNEHTLVPRPETELLVEAALSRIPLAAAARILDLGTGSGAIAIAIATERPRCAVFATDRSEAALELAESNAAIHCPERVSFMRGNWFEALPSGTPPFEVIISNPPYIGSAETELTDRELAFEPVDALYSGREGLDDIRQIIGNASEYLLPDGWLMLEHGFAQAERVCELLTAAGFESVDNKCDLSGQPRISLGKNIKP